MDADAIGTWLGIALAVAGFGVTWWQLWRTRSAAEAARQASTSAARFFARSSILAQIPALARLEGDLATAITSAGPAEALRVLLAWRHEASQVAGLLTRPEFVDDDEVTKLVTLLEESVALARSSERELSERATAFPIALGRTRTVIGEVTAIALRVHGRLRLYTDEEASR